MARMSRWSPSSREVNISPIPMAKTTTPAICTMVSSRCSQSSVSKAEANHVKLIQEIRIAKIASAKPSSPTPTWLNSIASAKRAAAMPRATTYVRS